MGDAIKIIEISLVPHDLAHYDIIVIVDQKIGSKI